MKKFWFSLRLRFILIVLLVFLGLLILFIPHAGTWLVVEQELQPADAIVVLMGSPADRTLEAYDVYEEGYAELIIMVESRHSGYDYARERGVDIPGHADITFRGLVSQGVPKGSIVRLPWGATSTRDEALAVRKHLEENPSILSIVLVSSPTHMRRARIIFRREFRALDHDVVIIPRPSRYSEFEPSGWYRNRENAKLVILEYIKLCATLVGV